MSTEREPYWDDLGMAWLAVDPDPKAIEAHLNVRLRTQSFCTQLVISIGAPLCLAMLTLATYTVYAGFVSGAWNFIVRGAGLFALSGMMGVAVWFQRAKVRDDQNSVARALDLAIARSRGLRHAAGMGMAMAGVAAVFGVAGYFVRVRLGHPPAMSPWEPLTLLALMATILLLYLRYTGGELDRLLYLKRTLSLQ